MTPATAWSFCAVAAGALLLGLPQAGLAAEPAKLTAQRTLFRAAFDRAERGDRTALTDTQSELADYPLWPDLEATYLRATLQNADHDEVRDYLERYGVLKPARDLRYQFALHLAATGRWTEYLDIYRRYYDDLGVAQLDCLAINAEIETGNTEGVAERGLALWRVGESQEDACDPVFSHLLATGALDRAQYEARFLLALSARQFSLARYLARSLDAAELDLANAWIAVQNRPRHFIKTYTDRKDNADGRAQLVYALERITYDDPLSADALWQDLLQRRIPFTDEERHSVARHIALWSARHHLDEATPLLRQLPTRAVDDEVRRWVARAALRREAWDDVLRAIADMPVEQQQTEEWRYWEAIALAAAGQAEPAAARLAGLAGTRSYYGFLAADAAARDYVFAERRLVADAVAMDALATNPDIVRARELFFVGIEGRGRSEWDAAVQGLPPDEQVQAALLAHRWGWHSRAIATVAGIEEYDDLQLRYPLPWREDFARYSAAANLNDSLAYGIARSESLFMRDIRSGAGAIGVMQVLPSTGRQLAREGNHAYSGRVTLTDSSSNIRLGTLYLQKLLDRFSNSPVLASAAYNAGPQRVVKWLPDGQPQDARIWVENIPYNETRAYVRRVLTADTIFHWRLTGEQKRISDTLGSIDPAPADSAAHSAE